MHNDARGHIDAMRKRGFNIDFAIQLFELSLENLEGRVYSEVYRLSQEIIEIREKSHFVHDFIMGITTIINFTGSKFFVFRS